MYPSQALLKSSSCVLESMICPSLFKSCYNNKTFCITCRQGLESQCLIDTILLLWCANYTSWFCFWHFWKYGIKHLRRASNVNCAAWYPAILRVDVEPPGTSNPSIWSSASSKSDVAITALTYSRPECLILLFLYRGKFFAGGTASSPELNLGHNRAQNPNHSLGHQGNSQASLDLKGSVGNLTCWSLWAS